MSKHTPEPWKYEKELSAGCDEWLISMDAGDRGRGICIAETRPGSAAGGEANARRIVTCVNACAGMDDPAAEIAELKRQRDELLAALGSAIPLIKQARLDWCDQNTESYDDDVVTPYDAILYRPILSLLETKGSAS